MMSASAVSTSPLDLPYLTSGIAAVPGAIKRRYEDFVVEEIPAYEPCGTGGHCFVTIEKRGLSTLAAVADIARALGVEDRAVGLAGMKDARGVTRQTLSIENVDPTRVQALDIPRIRVIGVARHRNKLRIGHLRGNRFRIRLRECDLGRMDDVRAVLDVLQRRGVPNYFGRQRFGLRGDTWQLGRGVLRREMETVVDLILGRPGPHDTGEVLRARECYENGDYAGAARAWPWLFRDNARLCRILERNRGNRRRAYYAIPPRLKRFYVGAFQSYLFNRFAADRIDGIDRLLEGDLAYKHENGAVFRVEDAAAEAPRCAAFEISPTGPLFGYRLTRATGAPGEAEQRILDDEGITLDDFRALKGMKVHGARRPLRFRIDDLAAGSGHDAHGDYIELAFALASGCYATMILRELCKDALAEGLDDGPEESV